MINLITKLSAEKGKLTVLPVRIPKDSTRNIALYEALFEKLCLAVQASANKEYGYFGGQSERVDSEDSDSKESPTAFHHALKRFGLNHGAASDALEALQTSLVTALTDSFSEIPEEDYYLWIAQCQQSENLPIGLFLLKHDASYFFNDGLELNYTQCIDPSKLKYAAVIDPFQWQQQSNRYVTLIAPKTSEPVNDGFQKLMGFTAGIDRKADTEEFLQMVEKYADEVIPDQKREVAPRVFKYCYDQDRKGRSVNIQKLSEYMDDQEPEAFAKYVAANLDTPPTDWHPDRREVQKHTKFFGRDNNISISFSSMMFGDDIEYDERTNSLTIRSLPKSLVRQIERYLRKSG